MIRLERVLQISVYLMAALSSLMLGMGEQVWVYVVILWMAAVAAYFYTDRWQWVVLPRIFSNILALAAGGLALYEVVRGGQEYQLLGVAHFLVYLQVIIFFQKKRPREYAQIAVLSLFQVMVAAVVSLNVNFALFLTAELFLSLWVLALLQLNRQWHFHRAWDAASETFSAARAATISPGTTSQDTGFSNGLDVGVEREFPANQLARFTVALGIVALGVAILVFPFVPRVRKVGWVGKSTVGITGLAQDVKLGNIKKVLESNEEVMTVSLRQTRNSEDEVYKAPGELLLKGYVLNRYVGNGLWEQAISNENVRRLAKGYANNSIRQEIDLLKNELVVLFAMHPFDTALYGPEQSPLVMDRSTGALLVPRSLREQRVRYTVYSPPQNLFANYTRDMEPPKEHLLRELTQLPRGLEGLVQFSRTRVEGIVPEPGRSQASQLRKARNLEAYFLDANRFIYSLDAGLPSPDAPAIDPVEDFLLNHKTGYCEYFASALTLMLRAADIPARMVAGYKEGEYNSLGDYYYILDKHAHNWVEAYVEDHLGKRRWIILDPTPLTPEGFETAIAGSWYSRFRAWMNYYQHLWSRHVVDLDNSRQQKAIRNASDHLFGSLARWREQVGASGTFGGLFSQSSSRGFWGRVSGVVLGVLALGGISLVFWLVVRGTLGLMRRIRGRRRSADNGQTIEVGFYRRLVEVLERHQLIRPPASSHREFAHLAGRNLAMQPHTQPVAGIPGRVIESFQRVRFGHEEMAPSQEAELHTAISELEKCIECENGDSVPEATSKE